MLLRRSSVLVICMLSAIFSFAQKNDYSKNWKTVAAHQEKGLTQSARKEVNEIFALAVKENIDPQMVKAAMFLMKFNNDVEEASVQKNIYYIDSLVAATKQPAKNILQSMQAELMWSFLRTNRYKFYDRTRLTHDDAKDINTWSLSLLQSKISSLYRASLENPSLLKSTPVKNFADIIEKGKNTEKLRPTLYDLLAHRALDYFSNDEHSIAKPSYKFIINDEKLFAPASDFIKMSLQTQDSSSLFYNALLLHQNLISFHIKDNDLSALIDADLKRLKFVYTHGVFNNKDSLYERSLIGIQNTFAKQEAAAEAILLRAQLYFDQGSSYTASNKTNQFKKIKAIETAEELIKNFPKSPFVNDARSIIQSIKQPDISIKTEKVNIPGVPMRMLLNHKNVEKIYFRIVRTTRHELQQWENEKYNIRWQNIVAKPSIKQWNENVPTVKDHQNHSTEYKIDALSSGTYLLVSSLNASFNTTNNILTSQVVYVSSISHVHNNDDIYILDRESGQPLAGASVQTWQQKYDAKQRKNIEVLSATNTTDKNGYASLKGTDKLNYNYQIRVAHKKDTLFTRDYYYSYRYSFYESSAKKQTFLFTDRSIYRPGQTVYFKGIVVATDSASKKSNVIEGLKTTIKLLDANHELVTSLQLTTNEYGSYHGNFVLPEGRMNGQFFIQDSATNSGYYFNVEEYKRPTFEVTIAKPTGTYKLNDTINVSGNASAYSGAAMSNATVTYRVVRKVRYPIWYMSYRSWPPHGGREEMEIANGTAETDAKGNFTINFKAIPDETVSKASYPTFHYEISTDVTDISGETRSAKETVPVSYRALNLEFDMPDLLNADSVLKIRIASTNTSGSFEKATVNLRVAKLQSPKTIYRQRFWEIPDMQQMTKEEFKNHFPNDAYLNEDQKENWAEDKVVIETTDTTASGGDFSLRTRSLEPGWYKLTVTAKDKDGEEVKAIKYLEVAGKRSTLRPMTFFRKNGSIEPGEEINYTIATGFDNIWIVNHVRSMPDLTKRNVAQIKPSSPLSDIIKVSEKDRGGIHMNYFFVKNNRVYTGAEYFDIPWSNKDLNITYETFRDKTLPGSKEEWKVKISGPKGEKVAAELLVGMYDASLDQFKPHQWQSLKSLFPTLSFSQLWNSNNFSSTLSEEYNRLKFENYPSVEKTYDELLNNGWNQMYARAYMTSRSRAANAQKTESRQTEVQMDAAQEDMAAAPIAAAPPSMDEVHVRSNFDETALFFPALSTNSNGDVSFSFTMPESLTKWKVMSLAHTKDLQSGYLEKSVQTQKSLMAQTNAPRFLREGDNMELPVKISNMENVELTGVVQLELIDALTNKPVDGWLKNVFPSQYFTVAAGSNTVVKFPITIPVGFNSGLLYRVKAQTTSSSIRYSDGEESIMPVLTNRMLVTETLPINIRNTTSKNFRFDKLLNSSESGTLTHHALTIEYTGNPVWYAIQALPYLAEPAFESADQLFNQYYANALAAHITQSLPRIKAVFEKWKITDTSALLSNLQKNQELKSVLLEETPWVLQAKTESEQKKNIAILFDLVRIAEVNNKAIEKLSALQLSNGGFPWFNGGRDDRYITQQIATGIGNLYKITGRKDDRLQSIADKAIAYLDERIREEYKDLKESKANLKNNNLSSYAIQYLYMRSFFTDKKIPASTGEAYNYYSKQAADHWLKQSRYMQGMIALALHRQKNTKIPAMIINSLKENAIINEEMGMYWKDNVSGYYWHQAPVETQSLLIEAFSEISKDKNTVDAMKTWLLKQKQVQNWKSNKATAAAVYALLLNGSDWSGEESSVTITVGNTVVRSNDTDEAGTGYLKTTIPGDRVQQGMGNISVKVENSNPKSTSTSWGAVYWQYFEEMDKITSAETPLKLSKKLFIENNSATGPVLSPVTNEGSLKVGDKVTVRIELRVDRDMEYVHMKDMRSAAMEPVNVLSGYKYQGGLGYYETTKDASTNFFFSWLSKGTYVFEYNMFVSQAGNFSNGITTIQAMYAPEFTSHSEGIRVNIEPAK